MQKAYCVSVLLIVFLTTSKAFEWSINSTTTVRRITQKAIHQAPHRKTELTTQQTAPQVVQQTTKLTFEEIFLIVENVCWFIGLVIAAIMGKKTYNVTVS